jgi:hypothetical protein
MSNHPGDPGKDPVGREKRRRKTRERKPYAAPVLREFGPVTQWTQGTKTNGNDGGGLLKKN